MIKYFLVLLVLCSSCNKGKKNSKADQREPVLGKIRKPEFQRILDSFEVKGSVLIYDLKKNNYYSNNFEWANVGKLPASTFKIVNSIIGLETGVIKDEKTIFKWDGKKKWLKQWEQDLVLKKAFQFSCVPCYQEVARNIGAERMNSYVKKFAYGNLQIDTLTIDKFWLEGKSKISQMQQIDFLERFFNSELPIAKRTEQIMRDVMLIQESEEYKLSGKTGLSISGEKYNGWFVGYLEAKENTYIFATNLEPKKTFDIDLFVEKRLNLTLEAFRKMDVIR